MLDDMYAIDNLGEKSKSALNDPDFDSDWGQYLYIQLGSSRLSTFSSNDVEDEGQADTHFKMFLDTIVPDGASYVLKRPGKPDLKFEGPDQDDDDADDDQSWGFYGNAVNEVDLVEISSDCESQQRRSKGRKDKGVLRADGVDNSRNVKDNGKIQKRPKGVGKKRTFEEIHEVLIAQQVDVVLGKRGGKTNVDLRSVKRRERDVKNGEKKQTLKENSKYRSVEQVDLVQVERRGKNVEKRRRFEEDESDSLVQEKDLRNVKEIGKLKRKAKNVEKQKSFVEYERSISVEDVNLRPDSRQYWRDVKENGMPERRANNFRNVEKEKSFMDKERHSSPLGKVSPKKKRSLSENIRAKDIDPDIKALFDQCEWEGNNLILVANGKRLKLGEDNNSDLSDSEVYVLDHAPDCRETNYAPTLNSDAHMDDDDLQCLGSCNPAENPLFRKAVIDILRKPFNDKEYQRLRNDVKRRKPIVRHVDMRSGNTSFQQSTLGKSYLDHYADLKKQFDAFKNNIPKRLNILRGFFFYLERAADDGKFKPWLDDSCLAIISRTD